MTAPLSLRRRGRLAVVLACTVALAGGALAWGYFKSSGLGTASASVGTLGAPTSVRGTPSGSNVAVSWAGVTDPGPGTFGYYVSRTPVPSGSSTDVCGSSPTSLLPAAQTSCTDAAVPNGTFTYTVTSVYNSFSGNGHSGQVVVAVQPTASAPGVSAVTTSGTSLTWVNGENVTLTDSASGNGGTLASVAYYFCTTAAAPCTSANWTQIGSSTSSGSWSLVWSAANLPADGTYDVVAIATTTSSLTSSTSTATEIGVDTTPPTVSTPSVNGFS